MAADNKQHIRLHLYDTDISVRVYPEDEPLCRNAAKLINEKVNFFAEIYKTTRSEKEILFMAMLDIASSLEYEKSNHDTEPYDNILAQLTQEVEEALGVNQNPRLSKQSEY